MHSLSSTLKFVCCLRADAAQSSSQNETLSNFLSFWFRLAETHSCDFERKIASIAMQTQMIWLRFFFTLTSECVRLFVSLFTCVCFSDGRLTDGKHFQPCFAVKYMFLSNPLHRNDFMRQMGCALAVSFVRSCFAFRSRVFSVAIPLDFLRLHSPLRWHFLHQIVICAIHSWRRCASLKTQLSKNLFYFVVCLHVLRCVFGWAPQPHTVQTE